MNLPPAKRSYPKSISANPHVLRIFCAGIAVVLLSACNVTFQSSQYNFVKGLFAQEAPALEKNWQVRWQGRSYDVYAINHEGGTFFANEKGLLVVFDGWQVTELSLPGSTGEKVATVDTKTSANGSVTLQYRKGGREKLAEDVCLAWQRELHGSSLRGWRQICEGSMGDYTNEIELNELGQLVLLRFALLPGGQPIDIELR